MEDLIINSVIAEPGVDAIIVDIIDISDTESYDKEDDDYNTVQSKKQKRKTIKIDFYKCKFCSMSFKNDNDYKLHELTHNHFKCPLCYKFFANMNLFRFHLRLHQIVNS